MPQARIDLYRQGATVSSGSVTIANGSTGTMNVFGIGGLLPGDSIRVGIVGPLLSVYSINPSAGQVTLSNSSGASVTIVAGTRLIDLTARPTAYADNLGLSSIGSLAVADSGGRATIYLPEGTYDYLVTAGAPAAVDTTQTATLSSATDHMTWNHTAAGTSRVVLVAVAWQSETNVETVASVTYAGLPMSLVATKAFLDLGSIDVYTMIDPPTGSQQIKVTWSGSDTKGAAAASVSLKGASQSPGLGLPHSALGSTSPASTSVTNTLIDGLVLGFLAVNTSAGTTTVTATGGGSSLWNFQGGSTGALTRTLGAAATLASNGDHVDPSFTISPARPWGLVGVEVLPAGTRLYQDESGAACEEVFFGINALCYASLQEAIDALPASGGVVYLPAGTYRLRAGLTITKPNVSLIGEGANSIITPDDPTNLPLNLLTIKAAETRLYRLKFDGAAAGTDLSDGNCGIVCLGQDAAAPERLVQHCYFENVVVTGNARFGLWLQDTIVLTAINCEFVQNKGDGVRIQGAEDGGVSAGLRFMGCSMSGNGGVGLNIGDVGDITTGQASQTFLGCTLEENEGASIGGDLSLIGVSVTAVNAIKLEFISCYLEHPAEGTVQFMLFESCPNVTVDNCIFFGNPDDYTSGPDRAVLFGTCVFARLTSNTMQGFKTEIANFDPDCNDGVEFCNRDLDSSGVARITVQSKRVVSTSQQSLSIPRFAHDTDRPSPSSLRPGALIWVDTPDSGHSHLQGSDGSAWVQF